MKVSITNKSRQARLAFTLVEVMVAMAILGIALLSLFASFSFGFGVVKSSGDNLRATQILQEKMETIRVYNWDQITNGTFIPTNFVVSLKTNGPTYYSGTIVITDAGLDDNPAYKADVRKVFVSLSWTNNNKIKRTRASTTFVSKYGMQKYQIN